MKISSRSFPVCLWETERERERDIMERPEEAPRLPQSFASLHQLLTSASPSHPIPSASPSPFPIPIPCTHLLGQDPGGPREPASLPLRWETGGGPGRFAGRRHQLHEVVGDHRCLQAGRGRPGRLPRRGLHTSHQGRRVGGGQPGWGAALLGSLCRGGLGHSQPRGRAARSWLARGRLERPPGWTPRSGDRAPRAP